MLEQSTKHVFSTDCLQLWHSLGSSHGFSQRYPSELGRVGARESNRSASAVDVAEHCRGLTICSVGQQEPSPDTGGLISHWAAHGLSCFTGVLESWGKETRIHLYCALSAFQLLQQKPRGIEHNPAYSEYVWLLTQEG